MALLSDWTGIFACVQEVIKYFNILENRQQGIVSPATEYPIGFMEQALLDVFEAEGYAAELIDYQTAINNLHNGHNQFKTDLINWLARVFYEVGLELNMSQARDIQLVLNEFILAMGIDSQTIKIRTIAVAADDVTAELYTTYGLLKAEATLANLGSGICVYAYLNNTLRRNLDLTETSKAEDAFVTCVAASTGGSEKFQVSGDQANAVDSQLVQGSGLNANLICAGNSLANGNFENWSNDAATSWSAISGTYATDMQESTTSPFKGSSMLELIAGHSCQIVHPVILQKDGTYAVGLWVKKAAGATGTIALEIVDDDGTTPVVLYTTNTDLNSIPQKLSLTVASDVTTSWEFKYFVFQTLGSVVTNIRISIKATSIAVANVYIDAVQICKMTEHNGMHFGVLAGTDDFAVRDNFGYGGASGTAYRGFRISATTALIQEFFARIWNVQLPSAAVPTHADPTLTEV